MEPLVQYVRQCSDRALPVFKEYKSPLCSVPQSAGAEVSSAVMKAFQSQTEPEMHRHVIVDVGSARSVCGMPWLRKRLAALKAKNRFYKFEETRETYRFGDGARVAASLLV